MQQMTPREILARLVGFDTVSRNGNLDLVGFAEGYLRACGAQTGRMLSADGRKAALFAHAGPPEAGGSLLSGHSDVVPVDGQTWTSDPFSLTERDGNLYGRGTCDMKGFDALALWAVGQAALRGVATPLQLALSYDEEVGCEIAAPLIAAMDEAGLPRAASAIIGEPSGMEVVTGHKGGFSWKVDLRGHEVHSSLIHQGVSAILYGARLIDWSNDLNAANRLKPPGPLAKGFNPPWTTSNVGMVNGGTAHNITAGSCSFWTEVRLVPGEDMATYKASFEARRAALEAEMQAIHPAAGIDAREVFNVPPLRPEPGGVAETLARALTGDNGAHVVSYGSEAGHFQAAGFSAVVCGPGHIAQAHQADEFISLEQFAMGQDFMERLLDRAR